VIKIRTKKLSEKTSGFCDIIDITAKVKSGIEEEKIDRGQVTIFVSGSTAALTPLNTNRDSSRISRNLSKNLFPLTEDTITTIAGATITDSLTCALHFSAVWPFPLKMARWRSALGSRLFYWISIIARAPARRSYSS
jgi:hypothetical protein